MSDLTSYTEGDAAEVAMCKKVGDVLQKHYPGYQWLVGISDMHSGVVVIDLPFKPPSLRSFGYLLHMKNADDDSQIMRAGGEWLERLSLARSAAKRWADDIQFGRLDVSNVIEKSRS
jgi:hypothetical protein